MKILVVDDNSVHQDAAKAQLKDHDLTVIESYAKAEELLRKACEYEVVLVDLLMPASERLQGEGMRYVGQEMPIGIFLALLAAKGGAKYVAVFTDSNRHAHPASACVDAFTCSSPSGLSEPKRFIVEKATMILSNTQYWIDRSFSDDGSTYISVKNWSKLLDFLLA
ncbi:MAG: response regulator [bacterium]|nr:response regulator [bacterium]